MARYMLLCYHEETDAAEGVRREAELPLMLELYQGLRESGVMVGMGRLRSVESATSVRVRAGETEIVDGPFAVTKERLAGYYLMECADLDEALKLAARMPGAGYGTIEVRPVLSAEEWADSAREAGADVPEEAVRYLT
jgi:hypothetical protein